ncbi:alpha/beta fold hydrolase [Deinococcus hopiensis]|uniref:Pimeloyl-ACP methyl ester carboxylesterase n=1 Tax=Deinococcus hopiensis KR-140 TaxID=695939 RepID=A0A1W1VGI5_9DEIO|nr:alpha/beta fold hydrolase [Deinococcus hopiensis]SMB92509.1 Pimeloyl-ACP methyl ester carboxylesterase [Deinococcus hopiensis KR-140]
MRSRLSTRLRPHKRRRALAFRHAGAWLGYEVTGKGSAPIVLVHGLSGSARWWRRNVTALSEQHRVYTIDLAGYGQARRQRALRVREAAALIAAWLDQLNLEGVTLIGHSMGGHISLHVAALRPARVRNLILACASGLLRGQPGRVALNLPRALMTGRVSFVPRILADAALSGPLNLWRSARDLLRDSVQDLLPGLGVRTLVIWGERDALVPATLGRALAAAIPGARYEEIPRAGHVVMVDAPEAFNRLVLDFLREGA